METFNKVYCPYFQNLTVPKCGITNNTCAAWSGNVSHSCPLTTMQRWEKYASDGDFYKALEDFGNYCSYRMIRFPSVLDFVEWLMEDDE